MEPIVYVVFTLLSVGSFYVFYGIEQLRKQKTEKALAKPKKAAIKRLNS